MMWYTDIEQIKKRIMAKKIWMKADKVEIPRPRNFGFWNITIYLFRGDFVLVFQLFFFIFSYISNLSLQPLQPLLLPTATSPLPKIYFCSISLQKAGFQGLSTKHSITWCKLRLSVVYHIVPGQGNPLGGKRADKRVRGNSTPTVRSPTNTPS